MMVKLQKEKEPTIKKTKNTHKNEHPVLCIHFSRKTNRMFINNFQSEIPLIYLKIPV